MAENSARLGLPLLQAGQVHKELTHNMALLRIDALLHGAVEADDCHTPPVAPRAGQCWIVPENAPDWPVPAGTLAAFTGQGWLSISPQAGMWLWIHSRKRFCWHDGTNWQATGLPCVLPVALDELASEAAGTLWNDSATGETIDIAARKMIERLMILLRAQGLISHPATEFKNI